MTASENPGANDSGASEIATSRSDHTIPAAGTATDVVLDRPDVDILEVDSWSVRELQDADAGGSGAPFLVLSKRVPRVGESAPDLEQISNLLQKSAAKPQVSDRGHKRPWESNSDPDPAGASEVASGGHAGASLAFGDLPTIRAAGTGMAAIPVSFDTEFVQTADGRRVLVSYQFATPDPVDPSAMVLVVFLPLSRVRLRLTTALREVWREAGLWRHRLAGSVGADGLDVRGFARPGDEDLDGRARSRARRNRLYRTHSVPLNLRCHFGKADMTVFRRVQPDPLKSLTSAAGGLVTLQPFRVCASDESRRYLYPFSVSVSDTMCHAPAGSKTLDALGAACGQPKVVLPDGVIERMDLLRRDDLILFLRYSANDPVVVHEYLERLYGVDVRPPVTLSGGAANAFKASVQRYWNIGSDEVFSLRFGGLVKRDPEVRAGEDDRSYYEKRGKIPVDGAARAVIDACANGYHGGLNMCPMPGYREAETFDFDLQGAYPTAMSLVRDVDWAHADGVIAEVITNRELTLDDVPGPMTPFVGWVEFEFGRDVVYPCLPIFTDGSPMYVRTSAGRPGAQVMGPEVYLALKLGARVHCQIGYRLRPLSMPDGSPSHALRAGVVQMVKDRAAVKAAFGKKSLEELAIKTMANSTYGKTAQDVAQQNAWDAYEQKMDAVGGSAITSPYHAAMTTSFVRAELLAAANQLHASGFQFFSVTTDGFISDADLETVVGLDLYGLAAMAADARALIADGDRSIWEVKHRQRSFLNVTTRGNVALNDDGVLAKNSFKTPVEVLKAGAERQYFFDLVISRTRRVPNPVKVFPSFRELSYDDGRRVDFIASVNDRELSMDYDCKRQPDFATMRAAHPLDSNGAAHEVATFDTTAWETIDDCLRGREVAKNQADAGGCLRTVAEWREWELRRAHGAGRRIADPHRSVLLSILIGHRQGMLGFDVPGLAASAGTVKARLAWLSGWGLGVAKESDWKNARRPDRLGQMLAPSACEPFLSAIRSAAPGSVPWDLTTESEGGGDEGAERAC